MLVALAAEGAFGRGMSDGVAATAGTTRARFAVSTVSCIFTYRAVLRAVLKCPVTCLAESYSDRKPSRRGPEIQNPYESVGSEVQMVWF